jgi:hypothetical protein
MVRYATCIEVIFLTAGRPSGAALLRLGLPLASVPTEKKYALLRIGLRDDSERYLNPILFGGARGCILES